MPNDLATRAELVRPRDIVGNEYVRKMCGRAFRVDRKPITRHTLISWRASREFPPPLESPSAGVELWDRRTVKRWIAAQGT